MQTALSGRGELIAIDSNDLCTIRVKELLGARLGTFYDVQTGLMSASGVRRTMAGGHSDPGGGTDREGIAKQHCVWGCTCCGWSIFEDV